jgi:hypothetical protein
MKPIIEVFSVCSDSKHIICQYEYGSGYNNRDVYRIVQSTSINEYWIGRTLDFGHMEIATKKGYKIVLLP